MENKALWLDGVGLEPRVGPAPITEPPDGHLLVQTKAVAVQPGDWKVQAGIIPIKLDYPAVLGVSLSGVVAKVGAGVVRFQPGDHVACNSTGTLANKPAFGAYQRYVLVPQTLASKIGNVLSFEKAASLSTAYTVMSALFLDLGLDRPVVDTTPSGKGTLLIWGISSSFGYLAAQVASMAGYAVVGVGSSRSQHLGETVGQFVDRNSASAVESLVALGPYKAVLGAADSAEDQVKMGAVLTAQGGGSFLSTMGVRPGVELPDGVTGHFRQFLDDYLAPENREFTEWVWWDLFERLFPGEKLQSVPLEVAGGLSDVPAAWKALRNGEVSGKRLIILPEHD